MADRARYDQNLQPSLIAVSNADGTTPVSVWADPSTHGLISSATLGGSAIPGTGLTSAAAVQIVDGSGNQITSFGGGTQYTDAGTPPTHPIGPTLEFNNAGAWVTVGSANPLPVTGSGGGTVTQGTAAALTAGWPTINGELGDITGTFTNATQTTSVTLSGLDGYANVLISINGTYNTATAVFEGSDDSGTTWYAISEADRTDSNVIDSGYTGLTNILRAWQVSIPGFDSIRVRSTAVASGTVNVRLSASASPTTAGTSVSLGNSVPAGTNAIGGITGAGSNAQIKDDTFYGDGVSSGILSITNRLYNGTTYDRWRGDTTNGAWVNVKAGSITSTPAVASAIVNNQQTATTSAVALPSNALTQGVTVEALSTNTVSVFVGASGVTTSTGLELAPGSAVTLPVNNTNLVFIRCASSTPVITFVGV